MEFASAVDQVIRDNLEKLRKPGVLFIRPGYKSKGGNVTDQPAIVVTVSNKRKGERAHSAKDRPLSNRRAAGEPDASAARCRSGTLCRGGRQCTAGAATADFPVRTRRHRPVGRADRRRGRREGRSAQAAEAQA